MTTLTELPFEIVAKIVRYANLNGDLARLRLCHPQFVHVISEQLLALYIDLLDAHGLTPRAADMFFFKLPLDPSLVVTGATLGVLEIITLGRFLQNMSKLVPGTTSRFASKDPLVLFAVLSRLLNDSATVSSLTRDFLAPSASGEYWNSKQVSESFLWFFEDELTLEDLASVFAVVYECTNKLWSTVFLSSPRDTTDTMDQDFMTEHVIWKGPRWVARLLGEFVREGGEQTCGTGDDRQLDMTLVSEGVWTGSGPEGLWRIANGAVQYLWQKSQEKVEQRAREAAIIWSGGG